MTLLTTWSVSDPTAPLVSTSDPDVIAAELATFGIDFERWESDEVLPDGSSQDDVLAAYRPSIDRLTTERGYTVVDVAQIHRSSGPAWEATAQAARAKFLAEHTHDEDEIRFFVRGSGVFYLHVGDTVVAVLCEAGDLISVPALTTHWFDMGTSPDFTAIRFFQNAEGWIGTFTGDPIAESFADYDTLVASRS